MVQELFSDATYCDTKPSYISLGFLVESAMTPQERQMIDDLFDRLARVESAPRDPEAEAAIAQAWQRAPNASYALVQTVLVQDEALKRAHERIEALEARASPEQKPAGGFLDSMRDSLFGQGQGRGSVPNVPPPGGTSGRPAWNTGQVLGQGSPPESYPPQQQPQAGSGGGSFLGTAAAAAAGVVGGSLLLNSIRSMMGGGQHGFGDASALGNKSGGPWGVDQSGGNLARDAGLNDIGSSGRSTDDSRSGRFDQAQADADQDQDQDQDDEDDFAQDDSDDFDDNDDSDFA